MAKFVGKNGSVAASGGVTLSPLCVKSFSIDISCDSSECTCMSSSIEWKSYLAGCKGWTASVECNADSAGYQIAQLGNSGTFLFTLVSGITLTGTGIVQNVSGSQSVSDTATVTYTIQGTGALTGA